MTAHLTIAAQSGAPLGSYPALPVTPGSADLGWTANTDQTDRSTPIVAGKTVVLAWNTDSGAHTITFTSVADDKNRTGDISAYSIAAGKISRFGIFQLAGWTHSGVLWIDVSDPKVVIAVITLP
jgi:hypothetical protein